ncbi:MAG: hypothetical protein ACYDIC_09455 [Desulfobaccales bacterium]
MAIRKKRVLGGITIILCLSLWFLPFPGLGSEPLPSSGASPGPQAEKAGSNTPTSNDYACFLAGLAHPGGPLAAWESNPAWIKYAAANRQNWEKFSKKQLEPMRQWAAQELAAAPTAAVFYPFSGPDFLNVYALFPRARTYVLVALEPVGTLPDCAALDLPNFLAGMQNSLQQYLYTDYFVTAKMATQISQSELKGVLPVLLFFLAREQARVLEVQHLVLKADGALEERPAAAGGGSPGPGIPGVRLIFTGPGAAAPQTLYYFQVNLQDHSLRKKPQFAAFLKNLAPLTTFTKSASFLLASPFSSAIRQLILEQSAYVLQDDSGIPLQDFAPATWNLRFYGTYKGPIARFKNRYQEDLAAVYNKGKDVYPLPFGIGYHFRAGTSNLLFAAKKQDQ